MVNDSADVTSSGRSFQAFGPATGKARLPTVDSLLIGTTRRLVPTERSDRRLGMSATRLKGSRYSGASPWMTCIVCIMMIQTNVFDSLRDVQPMEAGQRVGDVVGSPQVISQIHCTEPRKRRAKYFNPVHTNK